MNNKEINTQYMIDVGAKFESKNNGEHLIISTPAGLVDFWPSTGKYKIRRNGAAGVGTEELLQDIRLIHDKVSRPATPVDTRNARIAELEHLLSVAWDLLISEDLVQWPADFSDRVNAALQKPEAHNKPNLPWED